MKEFATQKIRNICFAGQRGSGKTSIADALAFCAGVNNRVGKVDDGSSILDYTDAEINRKTSISSKLLACEWSGSKLNILDCPGHSDFIGELLSALKVCDTVGVVINGASGVEVGTQIQWNSIDKLGIGRFFFVNKLENDNVKWSTNLESIKEAFGPKAIPVQIPIGEAGSFSGLIDLLQMKAFTFGDDGKAKPTDIPADLKDQAESLREGIVEAAAESDDALLEKFFEEGTLSEDDFRKGFSVGVATGKVFPVLFGSAHKNIGITLMLDFMVGYLPAPNQMADANVFKSDTDDMTTLAPDADGPPIAYVYKVVSEGHLGEMSFVKAMSGTLKSGLDLKNQQTNAGERVTQLYSFQGKNRIELSSLPAGDIGVLVKLKNTHVGNTLAGGRASLTVPEVEFPNPVMDMAIKLKTKGDEEKISSGLNRLHEEDPTFRVQMDPALKQTVLYAQGPTHIEVITEKLKTRFGVEVELARPKVPYRETVRGKSETRYRHKKQSGGRGQFGEVHIRIEPNTRGEGFAFLDEIKGGVIPSKFIPAVEKGLVEQMISGGLAGAPVVDVKVALYYGSYHEVDSSEMAFKIAGSMAFKDGFMQAKPVILEPIYNLKVTVPDDFTGDVMGDLSGRRGKIAGMDPDGRNQIVKAAVPQAELYQYSVDLRSMTQGQGFYSLEFSHYEEVPHDAAQKIIDAVKAEKEQAG